MIKIKEEKDILSIYVLIGFLNKHINNCYKSECNCKILEYIIKETNFNKKEIEKLKNYINKILNILNYFFESSFIEFEYYDKYELAILLSEHFCHLKSNSTMAFSIINTFIQKQKNNLTIYEMVILYELSQKYIYYISADIKKEFDLEIFNNQKELLMNYEKKKYFKSYFNNLKTSNKVKKLAFNYIDNLIKILKYKNIFEESISFQFDENNDNIISCKLEFLNKISNIENNENKINENKTNLYNVINLLKIEKFYHRNLKYAINKFEIIKDMPIFVIFKYYLFYDLLEGGKIPDKIAIRLHSLTENKINVNNNYITKDEYSMLKNIYNKQNNEDNSKYFSIFEFKKELRTKYFSESCSLKLGYNQKDIINETLEPLMPKEFYDSHQYLLKQRLIDAQNRYLIHRSALFDASSTILYSINFEALVIYNLSKNLEIICESSFIKDNQFKFLLNNNFELLAHSKNFEDEYYLNKKILQMYDIKIMDIFKIPSRKLHKKFEYIFQKINNQNIIRKTKIEEYLVPQLYSLSGQKNNGIMNSKNFKFSKNNIFSNILSNNNEEENLQEELYNENDEGKKFINKEKISKLIDNLFSTPIQIVFHDTFNITLSKKKFIENIAKELSKIPDNEIIYQNDKNINLIIKGKELIEKLLNIDDDLSKNLVNITIKLSYYYNKAFYFITVNDEKKFHFKMLKGINYKNSIKKNKLISSSKDLIRSSFNLKSNLKSKNNSISFKKTSSKKKIMIKSATLNEINFDKKKLKVNLKLNKINLNNHKNNNNNNRYFESNSIGAINKYREKVNHAKFILIIRIIMTIIICLIFILYILIIQIKANIINTSEKIILANYYNYQTKNAMDNIYSRLMQIYYEMNELSLDKLNTLQMQQKMISSFSKEIKEKYHNFTDYYFEYNLILKNYFNIIYNNHEFHKIIGFWEDYVYNSTFSVELDIIIYHIYSINLLDDKNGLLEDVSSFLFYNDKKNYTTKIKSGFIQLLFYISKNYELTYKYIFNEIHEEIKLSYNKYSFSKWANLFAFKGFVLLLYIIFFISVFIYLYYANQVIIKNIIFLFLDFSEKEYDKSNIGKNNIMIWKLIEFRNIIDDFNLDKFQRYKINIDKLNKNPINNLIKKENDSPNINIEKNNENEEVIKANSNNSKSSKNISSKISKKKLNIEIINENNLEQNNFQDYDPNKKISYSRNKGVNNSSHNYLIKSSNSHHIFKDNNSIQASNAFLNTNNNSMKNKNNFKNIRRKSLKIIENEEKKSFQEILLNQSNKSIVLIIKIYVIIIIILVLLIIILSLIEIKIYLDLMLRLHGFFNDFTTIIKRFSLLNYYFNLFSTLIIFHDEEVKNKIELELDDITQNFEEENDKYTKVLLNEMSKYKQTRLLFDFLRDSQNNSSELIKEIICDNEKKECIDYLYSKYNIFNSGIDFSYESCIIKIKNMYKDYKLLKNKTDIEIIKSKIINSPSNSFNQISLGISNLVLYIKSKIFQSFEIDQISFRDSYKKVTITFNIISIVFCLFTIIFINIFIFFTISRFSRPIKESTYRLNCSFYYIKKYSLNNYRKSTSFSL